MKKIIIGYVLILILSLTVCISSEERAKGKEQVRENKKIIKEYVRGTYEKRLRHRIVGHMKKYEWSK